MPYSHPLPPACGPLRLDFHGPLNSTKVMAETAPRPLLWTLHQPSSHWIAMNIAQLFGLLGVAPHVEIVITWLPQRPALGFSKPPRHILFQHL